MVRTLRKAYAVYCYILVVLKDLQYEININNNSCKIPFPVTQETYSVAITKPSPLMLLWDIINGFCQNNAKHINTLCGRHAGALNFIVSSII